MSDTDPQRRDNTTAKHDYSCTCRTWHVYFLFIMMNTLVRVGGSTVAARYSSATDPLVMEYMLYIVQAPLLLLLLLLYNSRATAATQV